MRIGVPKEIKVEEYRVGMTPGIVSLLVADGAEIVVETQAGDGLGLSDADYEAAGAKILPHADAVFAAADMIVKVKEPQAIEIARLEPRHLLFTYLHLAADRAQAEGLMRSGCTAIAYETVTDRAGRLPLLAPMSQVAGRMAVDVGAHALLRPNGGRGLLLGGGLTPFFIDRGAPPPGRLPLSPLHDPQYAGESPAHYAERMQEVSGGGSGAGPLDGGPPPSAPGADGVHGEAGRGTGGP